MMIFFRQFVSFLGIGGICTAIQYLILILLVNLFEIDPVY